MKNLRFHQLLKTPRDAEGRPLWTVNRLAGAIQSGRAHVTEVLNNTPGHGHRTRPKLVEVFRSNFTYWRDMVDALGWDESGSPKSTAGEPVLSGVRSGELAASPAP